MAPRQRIDRLLVARGLFESRAKAQAAIAAGLVTADDVAITKPSDEVASDAVLRAEPAHPWVSRGGVKLAHALDNLAIAPAGRVCLDVGASTGGFTEVLVARGARRVYALDVGRGQLHPRLRGRPKIVSLEGTDIRELEAARLAERPDLVTVDVSFISLALVLPAALALAERRLQLVALVKPQFEAGKRNLKKGIVRDSAIHAEVCAEVAAGIRSLGLEVVATFPSPILGGDGNHEFFIGAHRG
jgi:23S rRNA (cytidine1920-2'-O)/16S rRNA (cytidine1409-2'-O)-methyltransferase